jgi:hypothetical protein
MDLKKKLAVWTLALKNRNLKFKVSEVSNGYVFTLAFTNLSMVFRELCMTIHLNDDAIQTFVVLPGSASGNEQRVLDYFNRVNYRLKYGKFEMDPRDSEVRFHLAETSDILELPSCTKKALERQIDIPIAMIKYFGYGYERLISNKLCTAEEAIQMNYGTH